MAATTGETTPNANPNIQNPKEEEEATNGRRRDEEYDDEEEAEDGDDEEFEDDEDEEEETPSATRAKLQTLFHRLSTGPVSIRVHDVVIKGNSRTKESLIEAEVIEAFRSATTMQELIRAAGVANQRLHRLEIFERVAITLEAGPPELPGTANVVIEVIEPKNPLTGDIGVFSKPEARAWSLEGSLKLKNSLGYGDIWDISGAYGWDQTSELSAGLSLPRFKAVPTPLAARVSLLTQDWLKFSSYKERLLGISLDFLSTKHHNLAYNLTWRNLTDPSRMSSKSIRRQLGHSLLSSMKYTFKIDHRNSHLRPTRGWAFLSSSQVGGLGPDRKSLRFVRQEFDLRGAVPLGFYNAAFNVGASAGVVMPWGGGFLSLPTPLPDRFHMGGNSSPVCSLGGFSSLLGFRMRGLGPTDSRRLVNQRTGEANPEVSPGRDELGGDLAVTVFADLSFDLPLKLLRDSGIHGHLFASAGNLAKITEDKLKNFSLGKFWQSFRSTVGFGVVIPTKLFRMEINYCHILRQSEHDLGKTGIQFNFSSPS